MSNAQQKGVLFAIAGQVYVVCHGMELRIALSPPCVVGTEEAPSLPVQLRSMGGPAKVHHGAVRLHDCVPGAIIFYTNTVLCLTPV